MPNIFNAKQFSGNCAAHGHSALVIYPSANMTLVKHQDILRQMLNTQTIHPSWQPLVSKALQTMDHTYLQQLVDKPDWLPGPSLIFNAFQLPLSATQHILFGESPYPRQGSANGCAFWDTAVDELWSETGGLSTRANRATSLRNFIKMLLVADELLAPDNTNSQAIAKIDKLSLIDSIDDLFKRLIKNGFLLLNASLVLSEQSVTSDAKAWYPFMDSLLSQLSDSKPNIDLVLFGKIAEKINQIPVAKHFPQLIAEHPYNLSFITNPIVIDFFKPLQLMRKS